MDITWLGHAAFLLRSGNASLLMDPFPESLGLRIPPQLAKSAVVTVSNAQPDHSAIEAVTGEPTVLTDPGEYEVAGLHIKGIRTRLDALGAASGDPPTWNTTFLIEMEGLVVCHLGSLATLLSTRQVEELSSPQVLLVPAGGHGALSPTDAAELVNIMEPRIVVPMRYAHPSNKRELEPLSRFIQELGAIEPATENRLSITRSSLPGEMQVAVLQPAGTLL